MSVPPSAPSLVFVRETLVCSAAVSIYSIIKSNTTFVSMYRHCQNKGMDYRSELIVTLQTGNPKNSPNVESFDLSTITELLY